MTVLNSTVSGNMSFLATAAGGTGGGIFTSGGAATMIYSTVTNNSADGAGGGIFSTSATALKSTIIANNAGGDCAGNPITSAGHNLDSDNTCTLTEPTDLPQINPVLGPLAQNGGPTQTHALLLGSPAVDAGESQHCTDIGGNPIITDQRGMLRPRDGNGDGIAICDIGALESVRFIVNSQADETDADPSNGVCATAAGECTLRAAIEQANASMGMDIIIFNIPGVGPYTIQPASPLPVIADPVVIDGTTQPDFVDTPIIELDGTMAGPSTDGLVITAGNSTVRGLVINRFTLEGMVLRGNGENVIEGNFIGTDVTGTTALGSGFNSVNIAGGAIWIHVSPNNVIGGTTPAARNIISGNSDGVHIMGLPATGNVVQGNFIGTDITGTIALGNFGAGVRITFAPNNFIGGTTLAARNIISGNGNEGIRLTDNATGNMVQGNFIGTDITGTDDLGNNLFGVLITNSPSNIIGGAIVGAGNIISGSLQGVFIINGDATANVVQGNFINANDIGVLIDNVPGNTIGGTMGNIISENSLNGIRITGNNAISNTIAANSIFSNIGLGIDLGPLGVTPNDAGDGDVGPNNLQNLPDLTSVVTTGNITTIQGTLNSTANTVFQVEFFANTACSPSGFGEGETFVGSVTVTTNANNEANINVTLPAPVPLGQFITATATDSDGNTLEFSACVINQAPPVGPD